MKLNGYWRGSRCISPNIPPLNICPAQIDAGVKQKELKISSVAQVSLTSLLRISLERGSESIEMSSKEGCKRGVCMVFLGLPSKADGFYQLPDRAADSSVLDQLGCQLIKGRPQFKVTACCKDPFFFFSPFECDSHSLLQCQVKA